MVTRFVERCECASNADRSNIACWPDCGCLDQLADFPYLFWIWSGDCSRLARKFELEGGHDALDDLCHPVGHVAIGNGYVLYTGWVHSHPVGTGDCRGPDSRYPGPDSGLEAEGTGVLRRLFFTEPQLILLISEPVYIPVANRLRCRRRKRFQLRRLTFRTTLL